MNISIDLLIAEQKRKEREEAERAFYEQREALYIEDFNRAQAEYWNSEENL